MTLASSKRRVAIIALAALFVVALYFLENARHDAPVVRRDDPTAEERAVASRLSKDAATRPPYRAPSFVVAIGDRWTVTTTWAIDPGAFSSAESDHRAAIDAALRERCGAVAFTIENADPLEWTIRAELRTPDAVRAFGKETFRFTWRADDSMHFVGNDGFQPSDDPAALFFERLGVLFPPRGAPDGDGFKKNVPPLVPTFDSRAAIERLAVTIGEHSRPPLGGAHWSHSESSGTAVLTIDAYDRLSTAGRSWSGRFERECRGRYACLEGFALALTGEMYVRERIRLDREAETSALAASGWIIRQTATR